MPDDLLDVLLALLDGAGGTLSATRVVGEGITETTIVEARERGLVTVAGRAQLVALTDAGSAHLATTPPSDGDEEEREGGTTGVPRRAAGVVSWGADVDVPRRVAVLDTENLVRSSPVGPTFLERRLYQIGGVRTGSDTDWVAAVDDLCAYVTLDDPADVEGLRPEHRSRYDGFAVDKPAALEAFTEWLDGADVVVAHNGTEVDFDVCNQLLVDVWAITRPDEPAPVLLPADRCIDSMYLAHAVWPADRDHTLQGLAERHITPSDDKVAHDATYDARTLADVLHAAAADTAAWPDEVADLVGALGRRSPAWRLMAGFGGVDVDGGPMQAAEVRKAVTAIVTGDATLRTPTPPDAPDGPDRPDLTVEAVRGDDGHVSVERLVEAIIEGGEARPQQVAATTALHRMAADRGGLMEAPTGTGKTLALFAAALEWLDSDPRRRVVIATFTKALQRQLAGDVDTLARLLGRTSLVKGQATRLSLRGLMVATTDAAGARPTVRDPRFAELLIYLLCRLADPTNVTIKQWEARSIDAVDLPVALGTHCGPAFTRWCNRVSQATSGDYSHGGSDRLARQAESVRDALGSSRLVVANHALLLANTEHFVDRDRTLLLVDEAHLLEGAATDAIAAEVDFDDVHDVTRQAVDHLADVAGTITDPPGTDPDAIDEQGRPTAPTARAAAAAAAARTLRSVLRDGHAAGAAQRLFDRQGPSGDPLGGDHARTVVVSSSNDPLATGRDRVRFVKALRRLGYHVRVLSEAAQRIPAGGADPIVADRHATLCAQLYSLTQQLRRVTYDAGIHLGLDQATPGDPPDDGSPDSPAPDDGPSPAGDGDTPDGSDEDGNDVRRRIAANRVVWAAETGEVDRDRVRQRGTYPFTVTTSPIELSGEPEYVDTTRLFAATCYVSATLTVPDPAAGDDPDDPFDTDALATPPSSWRFIRDRLALPDDLPAVAYPSPFDYATQARLVAFADFPSWAEESRLATATVAHQTQQFHARMQAATGTADRNGVLVLTTSRVAAAEIAQQAGRRRAEAGTDAAIHHAEIHGNHKVAARLNAEGGTAIGTKGLWQGTDIADPNQLAIVWINKLPFAPFADPIIAHRKARVRDRAADDGHLDPDDVALRRYYLPLAALELRQAVGRLIRSKSHRGAIIISDRKLAGGDRLRRTYRDIFLGALDPGLLIADSADPTDVAAGNVTTMADGWARLWQFFDDADVLPDGHLDTLTTREALAAHTLLPTTRKIRDGALKPADVAHLTAQPAAPLELVDDTGAVIHDLAEDQAVVDAAGGLPDELCRRAEQVIGWLRDTDTPMPLKPHQAAVLRHVAAGHDVLALLPTGYGKSYTFQLPALLLPGVTVVVSPLVALMTDQALGLNHTIGGSVRALVGPMRESSSRRGKAEALAQLAGTADHGIKLLYVSPERLTHAQFAHALRTGVANGTVRSVAIDEAHTLVTWGEDFRPSFRRVERLLADLKTLNPTLQVTAVTATATRTVTQDLTTRAFGGAIPKVVRANPIRSELSVWQRSLTRRDGAKPRHATLIGSLVQTRAATRDGHTIVYCLTIVDVERLAGMLRRLLGADRVLVYHGRMAAADKALVANRFRDAARSGEDGYGHLVVVATAAFGLGVDRDDIRSVICATPPQDLAALYQQLGRAGRDRNPSTAVSVMSQQALRLARWMAGGGDVAVLDAAAEHVVTHDGPIDLDVAAEQVAVDLDRAGEVTERRRDEVRVALVRTIADLADDGLVDDGGDTPARITLRPGHIACPHPTIDRLLARWVAATDDHEIDLVDAAAIAAADPPGPTGDEDLDALAGDVATGRVGATWALLSVAHSAGWVDVSQHVRGSYRWLTDYRHLGPVDIDAARRLVRGRATAREATVMAEIDTVKAFHEPGGCAQQHLAAYFDTTAPPQVCATPATRCSTCWERSGDPDRPALYEAFAATDLTPATAHVATATQRRALDRDLAEVLDRTRRTEWVPALKSMLRGDRTYFVSRDKGSRRLPARLRAADQFGAWIGLRDGDLDDALGRLEAAGTVHQDGWKITHHRHHQPDPDTDTVGEDGSASAGTAAAPTVSPGRLVRGVTPTRADRDPVESRSTR